MAELLIEKGRLIDPKSGSDKESDVLIKDGKIFQTGEDIYAPEALHINAEGFVVSPGLIDIHTHLREPGREDKETIRTGTMSAVKGGFTTIVCKANTSHIIDDPSVVGFIYSRARREGYANVFPVGAVTRGLKGLDLADIGRMVKAGIVALSDDGASLMDSSVMRRALEYSQVYDLVVVSHSEDVSFTEGGSIDEGELSLRMGLKGIPIEAERILVARDCLLTEEVGGKLHIAHCSTGSSLKEIKQAKDKGLDVSCETAPHYFSLNTEAVSGYNTRAKMNPPLRSRENVESVISALRDKTIDIIASDHAPHSLVEKDVEFEKASFGIIGLETTLPLIITKLVRPGYLNLMDALALITINPAKRFGFSTKGSLEEGMDGDVTIFNPDTKVTIGDFASKGVNSPFTGQELYGSVEYSIVRGEVRYHRGEFYGGDKPFSVN